MIALLLALSVSFVCSITFTRVLIRFLTKHEMGQFIRQDGPQSHFVKRGTPTMGGVAIIFSIIIGLLCSWLFIFFTQHALPSISTLLLVGILVTMGSIGFIDDFTKISKQQSLGLSAVKKMALQIAVGTVFAICAINFPDPTGITPASKQLSLTGGISFNFWSFGSIIGWIIFIVWINFVVTAWSNAVNLTDGLDGLAIGTSLFPFAAYFIIPFWQVQHLCGTTNTPDATCYAVRDPLEIALFAACMIGAAFGFLWWNAAPAKIFMGDTGSLAIGGSFAAVSVLTHTEFLAIIIGGIFVMECMSDVIQVVSYKTRKKRVFKMAPIHHHFEFKGWPEVNVVTRFWILSAIFAGFGLALFYADWVKGLVFG